MVDLSSCPRGLVMTCEFADLKFKSFPGGRVAARRSFPNGFTASVVRGPNTYGGARGLYELAVLHEGKIVYDTPLTNDVLGNLTEEDVTRLLSDVASLPPRGHRDP